MVLTTPNFKVIIFLEHYKVWISIIYDLFTTGSSYPLTSSSFNFENDNATVKLSLSVGMFYCPLLAFTLHEVPEKIIKITLGKCCFYLSVC